MTFTSYYLSGLGVVLILMSLLWLVSVVKKNASIVDPFWGLGFVVLSWYGFFSAEVSTLPGMLLLTLLTLWGLRLFLYLLIRNWGKGEDFRYQQFRKDFGAERYWWVSFFQVFVLQGMLLWFVASPITATFFYDTTENLSLLHYIAIACWVVGMVFEAGGDYQLTRFKAIPENKGKLLTTGLWKYSRHPNYFGDALVWWSYGLFALAAGSYWAVSGSVVMTLLLLKVSGVSLLERTLQQTKPGYETYMKTTNAFVPWFPKKIRS